MNTDPRKDGPDPAPLGRRPRRTTAQTPRKRLSEILQTVVEQATSDRITVGYLLKAMEGRAFGALLLVFAFPNILPSPPGLSTILGMPLVFLSAQMMVGRLPWLPGFIANRSLSRDAFALLTTRATPWLNRAERLLKQRLTPLVSPPAERLLGALCLFLSLMLILPIPFGNLLPSFALSVIALGILERDGVWIFAGIASTIVAATVVGGLAYALVKSAIFVLMNAL